MAVSCRVNDRKQRRNKRFQLFWPEQKCLIFECGCSLFNLDGSVKGFNNDSSGVEKGGNRRVCFRSAGFNGCDHDFC